ncbi:unnamed protein product [Calypogeia fissa]
MKRPASKSKRPSFQETSFKEVNPKPKRSKNPEDYPKYIREVIKANKEEGDETPMEKMSQVTTKAFCQGLLNSLYPQVHRHSAELLRWSRFMAKEVTKLNTQLDELQQKNNSHQAIVDQLYKEKKDNEIKVLTFTNTNFKTLIDNNEQEVLELNEEKDEAVLDAANATSKVEALMDKIKELEGKLLAMTSGDTSNKRQRNT